MHHKLKTEPHYFEAMKEGIKTCTVRFNGDRGFQKGDKITFLKIDPANPDAKTHADSLVRVITYVSSYNQHEDYVVLSLAEIKGVSMLRQVIEIAFCPTVTKLQYLLGSNSFYLTFPSGATLLIPCSLFAHEFNLTTDDLQQCIIEGDRISTKHRGAIVELKKLFEYI